MATYDLEEQEQLDEIKTWWKQHGDKLTTIIAVVAVVAASWQGWNFWQRNQSAQASIIYAGLQQAAVQGDAKRSRDLAGELIDKFPRTAYAEMGVLVAARAQVDAGDTKNAKAQLAWAAEKASEPGLRDLARLRLASLALDEKLYDEAMKTLAAEPAKPFKRRFAELRGDVLAAQGKLTEAKAAYDEALAAGDAQPKDEQGRNAAAYADVIQAKRDGLMVGAKAAMAEPAPPAVNGATPAKVDGAKTDGAKK